MKTLSLILISLLLVSCATIKRNGYYQTKRWSYHRHTSSQQSHDQNALPGVKVQDQVFPDHELRHRLPHWDMGMELCAETCEQFSLLPLIPKVEINEYAEAKTTVTPCDTLVLWDGTSILGVVKHVEVDIIEFMSCDEIQQLDSLKTEDVSEIRYSNGKIVDVEVMIAKEENKVRKPRTTWKEILIVFVAAVLIIAFILSTGDGNWIGISTS